MALVSIAIKIKQELKEANGKVENWIFESDGEERKFIYSWKVF